MKHNFTFYFNLQELEQIKENYGLEKVTDITNKMIKSILLTKPNFVSYDEIYKKARAEINLAKAEIAKDMSTESLKKIKLENKLLERELTYVETFDDEPSDEAKRAMKKGVTQRELTDSEYENVSKYITLSNQDFKWQAKCDICKEGETYDTRHDAINDMIRHLTTEHAKKVMERRN